jgi:phospholipid/cholesterol/gamma-HCH transport system permease protein
MPGMIGDRTAFLGARIGDVLMGFGQFARFSAAAAFWTVRGPRRTHRLRLLVTQLFEVGTKSIPVVALVGAFVGMALAVEAYDTFHNWGLEDRQGGMINISVIREIGPVLAAVMIAGRVGGAVSAELGSMRVTEQLDALRVMGTDPVSYLVVPRVLACLIMVPVLTIFSNLMGIYGGYLVTVQGFGVDAAHYWQYSQEIIHPFDLTSGLFKSVFFGLAIGLVSCYKGFTCKPGAEGVGRAATEAFVTSFASIIIINFVLAKFLKDFYDLVYR